MQDKNSPPKQTSKAESINIYVDGSHSDQSNVSAWAAWYSRAGQPIAMGGALMGQDSDRMELMAIVGVLESLDFVAKASIYTDSKTIVDRYEDYRRGWLDGTLCKPANVDLWSRMYAAAAAAGCEVKMVWVRSHGANDGNNKADRLARSYRKSLEDLIGFKKH